MKPKFTPGPWKINKRASGSIVSETGRGIADCSQYFTNADNGEHIKENEANARLIVLAPDMFFVLSQIMDDLPEKRDWLNPDLERLIKNLLKEAVCECGKERNDNG